jgi:exo-beta-1,3-glucanase (GH17 family)/cellulose synthase/poly-beta-1,6-N-acetylglucosamine synthase-like glycosyltransferase
MQVQAATSLRHYAAPLRRWAVAALITLLVVAVNVLIWRLFNPPLAVPDVAPRLHGFAYNAFQRWDSPLEQRFPSPEAQREDLRRLAAYTDRIRTYSAAELPLLPEFAQAYGLRLALGVWLDRRDDNNQREIAAALAAAKQYPNVERLIAGNETQLHRKLDPATLHSILDGFRAALDIPVSTAEPWHVWLAQPELADHVDFITVHLLPFWEGVPVDMALDLALRRYDELQSRFPDKPIVIGEIGWPSGGDSFGAARASPELQARFVREFLARAQALGLDYYLMEAIDQPWKRAIEDSVGPHWGMLDAYRHPKFDFAGVVYDDPHWRTKALWSSLIGALFILPFLLRFAAMRLAGRIAFALMAQGVSALAVLLATLPLIHYLGVLDWAVLAVLVPALLLMAAILLAQGFEFAELFWPGSLGRVAQPLNLPTGQPQPRVSIHLACCNEPPGMVIATIDSVLALDWPDLELIVVDNNTRDAERWQPVADHVAKVRAQDDGRVHFFHLPQWPGFKAGALNFALAQTSPSAEWVAVVDADYQVAPDWLKAVAGHFADPQVGIVQAPQAHRDWQGSLFQRMMNWEYEGFFRIGMHHRHERDAIVQHGTMTVIRAAALRAADGWNEQCIVEDTELGLRLFERGWRAVYVDRVFGSGLVPGDFEAWCRQRQRWAQGAMQILRRHAGQLLLGSKLTRGQRYHFLTGWLPWIGDALHLVFSLAAIGWTIAVLLAPQHFKLPHPLFALPLGAFFLSRLSFGPLLYWRRVPCGLTDRLGAALAGMALSHTVARGVLAGLFGARGIFHVTRRARRVKNHGWLADVQEQAGMLLALVLGILAMAWARQPIDPATLAWMAILGLQSLPYAAAVATARLAR